MQKLFRVTVDISKKIPAPAFEVNTNDLKSVKLEITITNGQSLLDLTDVTPRINIRKPDNEVIFQDCEIVDATAGKVQIVLENQAYLVPGTHTAEIACYKGNEITAITGTFSYKSIKGIMNDEAVESKSEFTAIDRKIAEARKLLEDIGENGVGVDEQARQKIEEVTTQLAETESKVADVKKPVTGIDECIVSFVDDDGFDMFLSKFKPVFDAAGVKANIAVNTIKVGSPGYLSYSNLRQLQSEGYEISSHGHEHKNIAGSTDEEAHFTLSEAKRRLSENGIIANTYVYAGSPAAPRENTRQRELVKQYYDCGVATQNNVINTTPLDTFCLTRYDLGARNLDTLKSLVDTHKANKAWLIFMSHNQMEEFTDAKMQEIRDLIAYIKSQNIKITTLSEGLKLIGNVVEVGSPVQANYYALSKNGKTKGITSSGSGAYSIDGTTVAGDLQANIDTPLSDYTIQKTTIQRVASSATGTYPSGAGNGSLTTHRFGTSENRFGYQEFKYITNDDIFTRRWDATNQRWLAWRNVGDTGSSSIYAINVVRNIGNVSSFEKSITDFADKTITYLEFDTASGENSPTGTKGTLITYRTEHNGSQFPYQEWIGFRMNYKYMRSWTGSSWSTWKLISNGVSMTTSARNALPSNGLSIGICIYDTTLNKPVWRNKDNTGWVDATGTTV